MNQTKKNNNTKNLKLLQNLIRKFSRKSWGYGKVGNYPKKSIEIGKNQYNCEKRSKIQFVSALHFFEKKETQDDIGWKFNEKFKKRKIKLERSKEKNCHKENPLFRWIIF